MEVKLQSNVNGVRRNCWLWNLDIVAIWKTLDKKPEEISEGEFINIHEESGYDEKDGHILVEVILGKTSS